MDDDGTENHAGESGTGTEGTGEGEGTGTGTEGEGTGTGEGSEGEGTEGAGEGEGSEGEGSEGEGTGDGDGDGEGEGQDAEGKGEKPEKKAKPLTKRQIAAKERSELNKNPRVKAMLKAEAEKARAEEREKVKAEADRANLSEVERLKQERDEATQKSEALETANAAAVADREYAEAITEDGIKIEKEARKGFRAHVAEAMEADPELVVEDAIAQVSETHSYMLVRPEPGKPPVTRQQGASSTRTTKKNTAPPKNTQKPLDVDKMTAKEFREHKARHQAKLREQSLRLN